MARAEKPIVSVLVSNTTGDLLINYSKKGDAFVLIVPNYQDSLANVKGMGSSASRELSPGSIAFIVLGTIAIILIISGMWIIFYLVQRARRVEERERYAVIQFASRHTFLATSELAGWSFSAFLVCLTRKSWKG